MLMRRVLPSRPTFENPLQEFEQLRQGVLRLLDPSRDTAYTEPGTGVLPAVNVSQDDDNFYVRAILPGFKPTEISISALRNRLSIAGRRELSSANDRVSYHRRERAEDAFSRVIALPTEIVADRVDARYTDGVLVLTLPKAEATKARQILVNKS
jgi:HSP20 family protein